MIIAFGDKHTLKELNISQKTIKLMTSRKRSCFCSAWLVMD